jgi:beta-lactamase regulating signal transducer with metallopeptidase domain
MIAYDHWFTPHVTRSAAMTILHFLWQGAALAAVAYAAMGLSRRATTRYAIAVSMLALMAAAPALTFLVLQQRASEVQFAEAPPLSAMTRHNARAIVLAAPAHSPLRRDSTSSDYLSWLVYAWFSGVLLLSLRPASGFVALQRLRRNDAAPVSDLLRARCLSLQNALGIRRVIHFCESLHLEAPAVAGWFRPTVFLPLTAITGLSADQLDAVIAHELTHIRRLDAFVNLFQIAVETLLFYHPAVWWLSKRVRAERENCCDDVAIAVCGNAAAYATALASMAEWQAAPAMAMAANRSPLAARVARILGVAKSHADVRGASLAASALCLAVSLAAGHTLFGAGQSPQTPSATASALSTPHVSTDGVIVISPTRRSAPPAPGTEPSGAGAPVAGSEPSDANAPQSVPSDIAEGAPETAQAPDQEAPAERSHVPPAPSEPHSSYIDGLKAAGLDDLSIDQLIALKIQGVTSDYVRSIFATGIKADADDIVAMKIQGVTPELIKQLRDLGFNPDIDEVIAMKIQGVTPQYVKDLSELGLKSGADDVIAMKIQGVTPDYVRELRGTFPEISSDDIVAMKIQGVHPEYVRELREVAAVKLDADEVIGMKIQGVSPGYVRDLKALGLQLDADNIIAMKIQGVTPEFVKSLQAAGFRVDADDVIAAKLQGITAEFIQRARQHGFKDLDLDKLLELKNSGVLDE